MAIVASIACMDVIVPLVGLLAVLAASWRMRWRSRVAVCALALVGFVVLPAAILRLAPRAVLRLEGPPSDFWWLARDPRSGLSTIVAYHPLSTDTIMGRCAFQPPAPSTLTDPVECVDLDVSGRIVTLRLGFDIFGSGLFEYACTPLGVVPLSSRRDGGCTEYGSRFRTLVMAIWTAMLLGARAARVFVRRASEPTF